MHLFEQLIKVMTEAEMETTKTKLDWTKGELLEREKLAFKVYASLMLKLEHKKDELEAYQAREDEQWHKW